MYDVKKITELHSGDMIEGFYLLSRCQVKKTTSGKPYLAGALSDRSGSIEFKRWDYTGEIGGADVGRVIKIRGEVSEYNGALQMTVGRIRLADTADEFDRDALLPSAPIDIDETAMWVMNMLSSIEDEDYRSVCMEMLERHRETFMSIPAAKSVHHGFRGGLLMHTSSMMRLADFISAQYPSIIDRSLLIAGTFLHDLMKDKEFELSELGIVSAYSTVGQLLGHLVMGAEEVGEVARELGIPEEKSILLRHMILSHHGEPEFGAAVRPMCAEAELLSYIDLIDSRMQIYTENLEQLKPGEFSSRLFSLDKKIYKHN